MDDEVTITCPNHHQNLAVGLWNYFLSCRGVDFDVRCGDGCSIRAHHLILDLFLSPEKLNESAQHHQLHSRIIEFMLLFLYNVEVTVRREQLGILLNVARESDFKMLVDILESRFQDYFGTNPILNAAAELETCQNDDRFVESPYGAFVGSGNRAESKERFDQQCQAMTIKLEPTDLASSHEGELDSLPLLAETNVHEKQTNDRLNYNGNRKMNSPPNLINTKIENFCAGRNHEIRETAGLPCYNRFQSDRQSSSTNEEVDGNIRSFNQELEEPWLKRQVDRDLNVLSTEPLKADEMTREVPPTTSSGSSSDGSPVPQENSERFDFRVRKIKVEPDHNADVTKSPHRASENEMRFLLYPCTDCSKIYDSKMKLEKHMRIHTKNWPYTCDVCERSFPQLSNLKRHRMLHTGGWPYQCQQCAKGFPDRTSLTIHESTHSGQRRFQCEEAGCSATFACPLSLTVHRKKEHLNLPPEHQCHLCERAYHSRGNLNKHIRSHGRSFSCPTCHKSFICSTSLKRHQCSRDTGKTFRCDVCPIVFRQRDRLDIHRRTHTGIKPYQ